MEKARIIDRNSKLIITKICLKDGREFFHMVGTELFNNEQSAEKTLESFLKSQSKTHSFFESIIGALLAAPSAILTHKLALFMTGNCATTEGCQDPFILSVWVIFLLHSIMWKWIIRRIFNYFGLKSDPRFLIRVFINRLKRVI